MIRIVIVLSIALLSLTASAQQEITEGVIKAKMTMTSNDEAMNTQFTMLGEVPMTFYVKNQKSRTEQLSQMIGNSIGIVDAKAKKLLLLMDNPMGKKYDLKEINHSKEDLKNITVTETGDSKTIAGYKCKGYNIEVIKNGMTSKMIIYTTDKIKAPTKNTLELGGKLKGFPMHTTVYLGEGDSQITVTIVSVSATAEKVDDSKFDMTIPKGFSKLETKK